MILTSAYTKIGKLSSRIRIVQGGSSASKTYSILQKLILQALTSKVSKLVSIVTDTHPNIEKGAYRDFISILEDYGSQYTTTKNPLQAKVKDWQFEFFALDDERKAKGGRRDILFINEANRVRWETARQLIMRTRETVYIDYNPDAEFWAHEKYMNKPDSEMVIVTYHDNEACPKSAIDEIEAYRDDVEWYKVYGLGQIGNLYAGKIFRTWPVMEFPENGKHWYGLDFGFSNDPTAIIRTYIERGERMKIYLDELLYQKGLTNSEIAYLLKESGYGGEPVVCDSAEPKSIFELRQYGINATGADKRPGSLNAGIDFLKRADVYISPRSENLARENKLYRWKQDKDGKFLNQPIDAFNHGIDASRYSVSLFNVWDTDTPFMTADEL
jgi:phage terminase large subunit